LGEIIGTKSENVKAKTRGMAKYKFNSKIFFLYFDLKDLKIKKKKVKNKIAERIR
jgi:hypothetical protein